MHLDTYMLELDKWKNPTLIAEGDIAAFSRGVTDDNGYGYTLAASADGASAIARTVDERTVRLEITPNKDEYTIWIACPSKINTADGDTLKKAKKVLLEASSDGYERRLEASKSYWHEFWSKSFVQFAAENGEDDYQENAYYLSNYLIGSSMRATNPSHFMN